MKYNLKLTEYPDNIQISYYEYSISRCDNEENINDIKPDFISNISKYWYNPKTKQIEIIPKGYIVELDPFTNEEYLLQNVSDIDMEKEKIKNTFRSLRKTKQNIYEIARGSVWDLFITLTISDKNIRFSLEECKKRIGKRLNNIRRDYAANLKHLLIFERHPTSQAWHVHGLLKNIDGLTLNKACNYHTGELLEKNGKQIYNIKEFESIGYNTATFIEDNNRVTQYILKYISKDLAFEYPNKKSYLCSKGLPRGNEILLEVDSEEDINNVFNEYFGYVPKMTHLKLGYNYYNGGNVKYMQFRKDGD